MWECGIIPLMATSGILVTPNIVSVFDFYLAPRFKIYFLSTKKSKLKYRAANGNQLMSESLSKIRTRVYTTYRRIDDVHYQYIRS